MAHIPTCREMIERENRRRWELWRAEVEATGDWAAAYDRWLHPRTRGPVEL